MASLKKNTCRGPYTSDDLGSFKQVRLFTNREGRHGPRAFLALNAQVVNPFDDAEPAGLTPIDPPRISHVPARDASVRSPVPCNFNVVVEALRPRGIIVHSTPVFMQRCRDCNGASDGATGRNLRHHVPFSIDLAVLRNKPERWVFHGETTRRGAIAANVLQGALLPIPAGLVALASLIRDAMLCNIVIRRDLAATVATMAGSAAVRRTCDTMDENLRGQLHEGRATASHEVNAVRERARGGVGPARSAEVGNVLISVDRGKRPAGYVTYVPRGGQCIQVQSLPWKRGLDD